MRTTTLVQFAFASVLLLTCGISVAAEPETTAPAPAAQPAAEPAASSSPSTGSKVLAYFAAPAEPVRMFSGYAAIGMAQLKATPRSGGRVSMSFSDTTAPGESTFILSDGNAMASEGKLPQWTLGGRYNHPWGFSVGVEGQYYSYDEALTVSPPPAAVTGTNFATFTKTSSSLIRAQDLAATLRYARWGLAIEGLYGRRRGSFNAETGVEAFGVFTTGNFVQLDLSNGSSYEGKGDMKGFAVSYKVPRTWVSLYASKRFSTLNGTSNSFGRASGTVASSPSSPLVGAATVRRINAGTKMNIQDLEAGVQVDFKPSVLGVQSFIRLALQNKKADLDGPPTGGAGFGGTIGELTTNSFSSGGLGNIELDGYLATLGITF